MKNNNPKGILYILLGMMVFAVQDSIMKYIYSFVNLYEVYLVRTLVSLIIILLSIKLSIIFFDLSIISIWPFVNGSKLPG